MSAVFLVLALQGCATPVVMLKNDATGQVARCGGGVTGSMAGGLIGHTIEKSYDEDCVRDFEARGFKRVSATEPAAPRQAAATAPPTPKPAASLWVIGPNSHQIERTPEAKACAAMPVANLVRQAPGLELYTVACDSGDALSVRCEFSACRVLK